MIYSYGARVDNDSNAITVIDEENETAVTTGYVNGEYVEFSGGGLSDFSTAEVTITCTSGTLTFPAGTPHIVNDELVVDSFSVTPDNDVVLTTPLYKNKLVIPQPLFPTVSDVPTTTGAITLDFGTGIVIEGDGTISAAGM